MKHLLMLTAVLAAATPTLAHHAFSTYYFEDQQVSIDGVVVEFTLQAPHAWVYLVAPAPSGEMQRYAAEWSNPARLGRDKIVKDTLRAGDRVVISGSPGRVASEFKIHLKHIVRPADGWTWGTRRPR